MKIKFLAIVFSISAFSPVQAQNLAEIEKKFGAPTKSYSVSENIWMSPEFTDDGQLCMVRLYPKKIDTTNNHLGYLTLSLWEVKDVFDELAPVSIRGKQMEDFGMLITGGIVFSGFAYDTVRINFITSLDNLSSCKVSANKRRIEVVAEFPKVSSPEIVTITWLNRKCKNP